MTNHTRKLPALALFVAASRSHPDSRVLAK